jgi:1,4-alpha-glucan branching enzyme
MKKLVDAAHQRHIGIIVDAVYAHTHPEFAYTLVYQTTEEPNPMMGEFGKDWFKWWPGTDYGKQFTIEFFHEVNKHWLEEYQVDGFRYDFVPGMYDGPKGPGYADLAYRTYQDSLKIARFQPPGLKDGPERSTLIQCAEHVEDPRKILGTTYSNCCWQDELMRKARDMAKYDYVNQAFAHLLDPELNHYPAEYKNPEGGQTFPVAPFQYLESHDHRRFVNHFGELDVRDVLGEAYGDRDRFYYKEQPYIIALYTGKGIPMLWQGQEFGENWGLPEVFGGKGLGRNLFERPLHWEFFYDRPGRVLVGLHRMGPPRPARRRLSPGGGPGPRTKPAGRALRGGAQLLRAGRRRLDALPLRRQME